MTTSKDHWNTEAYSASASFVPQLTTKVVHYLSPSPGDQILDVGCGDAVLTLSLAAAVGATGHVTGLDASPSFITTAKSSAADESLEASTTFVLADCRRLSLDACPTQTEEVKAALRPARYDKVFSNAAMHWILRDNATRVPFFRDVFALLKPGGTFVFEMGGHGNVNEIQAALTAVLHFAYGVPLFRIREANPWFFASVEWMRERLVEAGFVVEVCESEERPTRCTEGRGEEGGLKGWIRLMGAQFLECLEEAKREEAISKVASVLEDVVTRENGSMWLGYVRLRAVARRPA